MYLSAPLADPLTRKPVYTSMLAEHTALDAYKYCAKYVWSGFLGIGSI